MRSPTPKTLRSTCSCGCGSAWVSRGRSTTRRSRLGRLFAAAERRPITLLTFAGGFASTVSWPATHVLLDAYGWRGTYLVYAGLLALVAAPLHFFVLARRACEGAPPRG